MRILDSILNQPGDSEVRERGRGDRFLSNVLWSWMGVGANIFVGLILSRYIIRKLGDERYGIWALVFSIIDYFWFLDMGLNPAVTNFCARYLARRQTEKINEVVNTALFYFSLIALVIMTLTMLLARQMVRWFNVAPAHRAEFSTLILITGLSWSLCVVLHMFVSCLDGFQRFDLTSPVLVGTVILRSAASALLLMFGYGLVAMGISFVCFQVLGYVLNFLNFRRAFPELRFSRRLVKLSVFREILDYGLHSFLANASTLMLNQSGPVLIGHYLPTAFVGYYTLPARLLQYAVDGVSRIGLVTRSSAAELGAIGQSAAVIKLGIYSNRYSFTLFMPMVIILMIYGGEVIRQWVGPNFAEHSAPLLPILLTATALVLAGQFNSSALLFGINKHNAYARAVFFEALANIAGLILVIPRYGILGAAYISSVLMLLFRGIVTPLLVCRSLEFNFWRYMAEIYVRPILAGIPALACAYALHTSWLPGRNWSELGFASVLVVSLYIGLAFYICIERSHRRMFLSLIPFFGSRLRNSLYPV